MSLTSRVTIIGVMSGTSLDGLDIAHCTFSKKNGIWNYKVNAAKTISYSPKWRIKLLDAHKLNGMQLTKLNADFGVFIGQQLNAFCTKHKLKADYVASHGHTVFHQPQNGFTLQIGSGAHIAAVAKMPVVCDFRLLDVANGGQGAPLVPIGDELLFPQYDFCLNLGGFANVSYKHNKQRIAYDICPVNIVLNDFAARLGKPYDNKGAEAAKGKVHLKMLEQLNELSFYKMQHHAKSLGREWVEQKIIPITKKYKLTPPDLLATFCEHIAMQIGASIASAKSTKVLLTGGGAYNSFLVKRVKHYTSASIVIPTDTTIQFKEALIFAFLGVLRVGENTNTLASVTGAKSNSVGGCIYLS
ncbi:MAG: anhydro-N-acetylmuramic acid kinase [Bacteroidetes bacterium]|nr:anhydro-N-acetylmuramic acid kinase [Bacteroidota bacterium]